MRSQYLQGLVASGLVGTALLLGGLCGGAQAADTGGITWTHLSTVNGDIPEADVGRQVGSLILDINGDGYNDYLISGYGHQTWSRFNPADTSWTVFPVGPGTPKIEAGGTYADIDGDGDLDVVQGSQGGGGVWWFENPSPNYSSSTNWSRHTIYGSGTHHDQQFGDFDGDGQVELVFYNDKDVMLAEMPANPTSLWDVSTIVTLTGSGGKTEGLACGDVDGNGVDDIVGAGHWISYEGNGNYQKHVINTSRISTRSAVGDLIPGGYLEVVFNSGDQSGPLEYYEFSGGSWQVHTLIDMVDHGHTLQVGDINLDGFLDIFAAEMHTPGAGSNCNTYILYGDGAGSFSQTILSTGIGSHESRIGDLDGDGDLDILQKDFDAGQDVHVYLNNGTGPSTLPLDSWERHQIDSLPHISLQVMGADLDGDGRKDLITGGWWYSNPGDAAGTWTRQTFGSPLNNAFAVFDADGDGDNDVVGTQGQGNSSNHDFAWARNDGGGSFTVLTNITSGGGDFVQGVAVDTSGARPKVYLSWHMNGGIDVLGVPADASTQTWPFTTESMTSQHEDLSLGDIDDDGDLDLLLGTQWLERTGASSWTAHNIGSVASGVPDRNDLADIDNDGDLDAVVACENGTAVYWFQAPDDPTQAWTRHQLGTVAGQGFSMDVSDLDKDGDTDVVVGEHRNDVENRVLIFENQADGASWQSYEIDSGPEGTIDHHDGTQVIDIDDDGDDDLMSIGYYNAKLWLFENTARCDGCSDPCELDGFCGDGIVDPGCEECDDGNLIEDDGCQSDCTVTPTNCSGRRLVVRDKADDASKRRIIVLSKDGSQISAPSYSPVDVGATLVVQNVGATTDARTFDLPAGAYSSLTRSGWKALGAPPGSKGFKYLDRDHTHGPCKLVLIRPGKRLKAVCSNRDNPPSPISYTLNEDDQVSIAIKLSVGTTDYCMVFENNPPGALRVDRGTGETANGAGLFRVIGASAPVSCPIP